MMLAQRLILRRRIPRYVSIITHVKNCAYSTKNELDPNLVELQKLRLPEQKQRIPQRKPFVKNFFLGRYDEDMAAFPEPQTHERHHEFFEWLETVDQFVRSNIDAASIDKLNQIPPEIMEKLESLDVFRASVPDEYDGLGLNHSEHGKLIETLSRVPCLGVYFAKRAKAIDMISTYGSNAMKSTYLPKIANGQCNPTLCITEDIYGSHDSPISTEARISHCSYSWILNGTKTYVWNADNSDLFIVVAECPDYGVKDANVTTTSMFPVERSANGITVSPPVNRMGMRGLSQCEVQFKNTEILVENVVGAIGDAVNSYASIHSNGRQDVGAIAIGITKTYLELFLNHMKKDKNFNAIKFKNDHIQHTVGKICCSIYAMESISYLTTAMKDTIENQDCDIETCIVESFCVDTCIQTILMGSHVLGSSFQSKDNRFEQCLRDAICLSTVDGTKSNLHNLIGLMGTQYHGLNRHKTIFMLRKPFSYPFEALKRFLPKRTNANLHIAENLHPSFETIAGLVEGCIIRLSDSVEEQLTRHGTSIVERHIDLKRISEVASMVYVITAVISRASRSYCLGMRNSELEVQTAQILSYELYHKIRYCVQELNDASYMNGDMLLMNLSDIAFEKDSFFLENPFARNF